MAAGGRRDGVQHRGSSAASARMAEQQYLYACYVNCNCNNCNLAARAGLQQPPERPRARPEHLGGRRLNWLSANGGEFGFAAHRAERGLALGVVGRRPRRRTVRRLQLVLQRHGHDGARLQHRRLRARRRDLRRRHVRRAMRADLRRASARGRSHRRGGKLLQRFRTEHLLEERRRRRLRRRAALDQRVRERGSQQLGSVADRADGARRLRPPGLPRPSLGGVPRRALRGPPRRRRHGPLGRSIRRLWLDVARSFAMSSGASLSIFDNTAISVPADQHIAVDAIQLLRVRDPIPRSLIGPASSIPGCSICSRSTSKAASRGSRSRCPRRVRSREGWRRPRPRKPRTEGARAPRRSRLGTTPPRSSGFCLSSSSVAVALLSCLLE